MIVVHLLNQNIHVSMKTRHSGIVVNTSKTKDTDC